MIQTFSGSQLVPGLKTSGYRPPPFNSFGDPISINSFIDFFDVGSDPSDPASESYDGVHPVAVDWSFIDAVQQAGKVWTFTSDSNGSGTRDPSVSPGSFAAYSLFDYVSGNENVIIGGDPVDNHSAPLLASASIQGSTGPDSFIQYLEEFVYFYNGKFYPSLLYSEVSGLKAFTTRSDEGVDSGLTFDLFGTPVKVYNVGVIPGYAGGASLKATTPW